MAAWPRSTSATTPGSVATGGDQDAALRPGARPSFLEPVPPRGAVRRRRSTTPRSSPSTTPARTTPPRPAGAVVPVPFIVMEYVEGQTLRELLSDGSPLEPAEAARITEGVLAALGLQPPHGHRAPRHQAGQRDDRSARAQIKVMDFGIARAVADANATMTQTQAVIGTAQYLSPGAGAGPPRRRPLRPLLHRLPALRAAHRAPAVPGRLARWPIAYQHVGQPPPRPSTLNPDVDHALDAVVLHALAKDREARYQDATAFRADLQAARLGRPISDAARGTAAAARPRRRSPLAPAASPRPPRCSPPPGARMPRAAPVGVQHGHPARHRPRPRRRRAAQATRAGLLPARRSPCSAR